MTRRPANSPGGHDGRLRRSREIAGIAGTPVLASQVGTGRTGRAVGLRAGQNVVLVRLIAASNGKAWQERSAWLSAGSLRPSKTHRSIHSSTVVVFPPVNPLGSIISRITKSRAGGR